MIALHDDKEPKTVNKVLFGPRAKKLIKIMEEEIESMKTNQVWDLIDLPLRRRSIENKWILKIKCKADESLEQYKAWLVAKGYT